MIQQQEDVDVQIREEDVETVRAAWDSRISHEVCPTPNEVYEVLQRYPLVTAMQSLNNLAKRIQRERITYLPDELVLQIWPQELEKQFSKDKNTKNVWRARHE